MALQMRQELRMSQQLVMTPQLQQAIKLLQLSRTELVDLVRSELLENPVLEESQELGNSTEEPESTVERQEAVEHQDDGVMPEGPQPERRQEVQADAQNPDNFDWDAYLQAHSMSGPMPSSVRPDDDLPGIEATLTRPETLVDHMMWQVRLSRMSEHEELIAEYIANALDNRGMLHGISVMSLARKTSSSVLQVEQVLRKIQQFDPISIGSRNLSESLWVQVHHPDTPIDDPLVKAIIARHLPNLERRSYQAIAKDMGEQLEEVYEATKIIMALEPRPARGFIAESPQYITPDVYVQKIGNEWNVSLNDDGLPRLKISGYYRSALSESGEARDYISERLRSAQWLIRSIQQRQRTIVKVTDSILKFQAEFFEKGPQHLRPLILKDVAEDIGMHESTVSRVTTNKYMHTQQGIFELKYFFNAGIRRGNGDDLASEAVKTKIKALIDSEDPSKPFSDQKLVTLLADENINIARRTVAKYREQLGVGSSSKRRKQF